MSYAIFTDTSANLPQNLAEEHHIQRLALTYTIFGEEKACMDTGSFDGEAYYSALREGEKATTSMLNEQGFLEAMEPLAAAGTDILYIGMSSGISGTYAAADLAAKQLKEAYPERTIATFDTLGASLGEGMLVLEAARMRDEGKCINEVLEILSGLRRRMKQVFTVDDLMYLQRGGRVSKLTAVLGSVLNIKPILQGNYEGKIVVTGKVRGRKSAIRELADSLERQTRKLSGRLQVGIAQAGCLPDAELLSREIRQRRADVDILLVDYEPVTGAHVGPGALALFYLGDEDEKRVGEA